MMDHGSQSAQIDRHSVRRTAAVVLVALLVAAGCAPTATRTGDCGDPSWTPPAAELIRTIPLPQAAGPVTGAAGRPAVASSAPMFILPLDRHGAVCDDEARSHLRTALKEKKYTDIYLLCPGWSDGWYPALSWMTGFATGFEQARLWAANGVRRSEQYNPLYVGILWPGAVLNNAYPARGAVNQPVALRPDVDRTALLNVLNTDPPEVVIDRIRQALMDQGHQRRAARLLDLLKSSSELTPPQQIEFADCLLPLYGPQAEPSAPGLRYAIAAGREPVVRAPEPRRVGLVGMIPAPLPPIHAAELLNVWKDTVRTASATIPRPPDEPGDDTSLTRRGGLSVAELVRWALHATDLRVMKDRAYIVGRSAISDVLGEIRNHPGAALHVVAHSFGSEAVLSAIDQVVANSKTLPQPVTARQPATRPKPPVDTLLLLSPLVNAWAIADPPAVDRDVLPSLQSEATPGGYRRAVETGVEQSVIVLYSARDWIASYYAPLALRHPPFEGLAPPESWAGVGDGFATMGGIGPKGLEMPAVFLPLIEPGAGAEGPMRYSFPPEDPAARGPTVIAIDAASTLWAHGDANDRTTWWLLANQVEQAVKP